MASFKFTVNTDPMANEIKTVSNHVDAVSGSVVAMQMAVIQAEKEGADAVCRNVNNGFYSLMQSQISQKIAALTSRIEAKLIDMNQQAMALRNIQNRMERDYNMISRRYNKLFNSLNTSLLARIYELDKPVVSMVNKDMALVDSRVKNILGSISVNQGESILSSQIILASKTKNDGAAAIKAMHQFVRDVNVNAKQSEAVVSDIEISDVDELFLPIVITESSNEIGTLITNYYAPICNIETIDDVIVNSARQDAINTTCNGNWQTILSDDRITLDSEFSTILLESSLDERIRSEMSKMYNAVSDVKQLKSRNL